MEGAVNSNNQTGRGNSIVKFNFIFTDRDASVVIGRSGNIIKEIIDKSNCKLAINGQQGMERYLTISGTAKNLPKAVHMVADILSKRYSSSEDLDSQDYESIIMLLLLPVKLCGAVIGKRGANVKTIMDESGAKIRVYFDSVSKSGERTTKLEGSPEAIGKAMEYIAKFYAEFADDEDIASSSSHSENTNRTNSGVLAGMTLRATQTFSLETEIAKLIIGKNGSTINEIRSFSRAHVKVETSSLNNNESIVTLSGMPSSVAVALHLIEAKIGSFVNQRSRFNKKQSSDIVNQRGSTNRGTYQRRENSRGVNSVGTKSVTKVIG